MTFIAAISCATAACAATDVRSNATKLSDVAPYPAAQKGQVRNVIWLPEKADEDLFKVELVPGKVMQTDCNTRSLMATLTAEDLSGWGYTYYELTDVKGPIATMMACPEGTEKEAFVAAQGDNYTVRYNSKLPIVVYTPADIELRYRIWSGSEKLQSAQQQ
ncbi:serine protease inhibitor ecotin [Denitrificimonas caeni]|uniref:Serine protease inhibitor ecotin n=2 Tax=Denitrificimonas caeni TaxID=521720 RepID=A0AAE9VSQ7_9GAMM|nr:serine protease inhibitor ecotin [Denitrificimonas caeni]WBE26523.1 serine protease inhibitor ecotin [Denitrificimonas caeni]